MNTQYPRTPSLFDNQSTGEQLRDRGVAAVLAADVAINRSYHVEVEAAIAELAASGRAFTADHVRERLPDEIREQLPVNLLPALIRTYAGREQIRHVGWATSTRASRHKGAIRWWMGAPDAGHEIPEQRSA